MRSRQFVTGALLAISAVQSVSAQVDTVKRRRLFGWRDVALVEAFAIASVGVAPLDKSIASRLQNPNVQENRMLGNTATIVKTIADPGSFLIGAGLYAYGRLAKNERAADLGLHGTEALAIGAGIGNVLKGIVGRARPYKDVNNPHDYVAFRGFGNGTDYRSFPSGHTIAAFAAASAVTSETSRWWPKSVWFIAPTMYGGAAAVGASRMYNNKHWASDVITGAAIGTFAGLKVVQWHHSHAGNWIDRIFLAPRPQGVAVGISK
jgi:membrane-associated phospholipid phosphatase